MQSFNTLESKLESYSKKVSIGLENISKYLDTKISKIAPLKAIFL